VGDILRFSYTRVAKTSKRPLTEEGPRLRKPRP
jgi:hypothetical protein